MNAVSDVGNAMESFAYASNFNSKSIVVETTAPTISNVTSSANNGTCKLDKMLILL